MLWYSSATLKHIYMQKQKHPVSIGDRLNMCMSNSSTHLPTEPLKVRDFAVSRWRITAIQRKTH